MPDILAQLSDGFMPHGYCLHWDGPLISAFIVGNLGIAIAYFLIPVALRYFTGKRQDLPYPYMFSLFAAFILSCGLTHIAKVWTLYQPQYWIEAGLDLWTAAVSLLTAALLFPLIPKALALRSPKELEVLNHKLENEIEERNKIEEDLRTARDQAIQANILKSQFVANISHEVRTPMSSLIGLVEVALMDESLKDDTREILERAFGSSKNLLGIVNDLLDFSKLEVGRIELLSEPFSVRRVITQVVELSRPFVTSKDIALRVIIDERLPEQLLGDAQRINQVLMNLVHNATKFTDRGEIKVEAEVESHDANIVNVRFTVLDTGIGISEQNQKRLFQPFMQAHDTSTQRYGGTGLGLSIAKKFVDLMGGQFEVRSREGQGSTFAFTIPLKRGAQ